MKVILASNSPRRKELLELAKVEFEVITKSIKEELDSSLSIPKQIEQLALQKALSVAKDYQDALVIGADTVVVVGNEILGKPKDQQDALEMINKLQDNTHKVITAVAVCFQGNAEVFHEITDVAFYPMSDMEIKEYLKLGDIYDKAGAYAIQGDAALYIKSINGDYYNVMGLPIAKLIKKIKKYL